MARISNYALQYSAVNFAEIKASSADLFITEGDPGNSPYITGALSAAQLADLKAEGRQVVGYVDVAVTDALRPYWREEWTGPGDHLRAEDDLNPVDRAHAPDWLEDRPTNSFGILVKFWESGWHDIVIQQVLQLKALGYSGVFLDDVAAYDDTFTEAERDTPAGRAAIGQNAFRMMELVAAIRDAAGPDFLIVANADPYMTTYLQFIPPSSEVDQAKTDYLAAVDVYLLENPTSGDVTAAGINLPPGSQVLILQSLDLPRRMPEAEAASRAVLYVADNSSFNSLGYSPYPWTNGPDNLAGGDGPNEIDGFGGNDRIDGFGGNDLIRGGPGDDTLAGGTGADQLLGGDGNDVLYFGAAFGTGDMADGGPGRDVLVLQGHYSTTLAGANATGIEAVSLQSGGNAAFGDTANNSYDFSLAAADSLVGAGQQLIVNGQSLRAGEDLTFNGSAETNGSFLVYAGHGVDTLRGGAGGDIFFFEGQRWGSSDRVDGGGGQDSVIISSGSGLNRFVFGETSFANIEAISVNARFASDPSQKPSYELVLANGNVASGAMLVVNGNSLADPSQFVHFNGSAVQQGNLTLFGGAAHDTLTGGGGADLLYGARGADALTGGGGADIFRYDAVAESVAGLSDVIGDFAAGIDKVDLSRIDANSLAAGDQAFAFIGGSAFSGSAGQLRIVASNGFQWAEGDVNGDGAADLVIGFQVGAAPLSAGDFIL